MVQEVRRCLHEPGVGCAMSARHLASCYACTWPFMPHIIQDWVRSLQNSAGLHRFDHQAMPETRRDVPEEAETRKKLTLPQGTEQLAPPALQPSPHRAAPLCCLLLHLMKDKRGKSRKRSCKVGDASPSLTEGFSHHSRDKAHDITTGHDVHANVDASSVAELLHALQHDSCRGKPCKLSNPLFWA
eukprot:660095-Pelagomonas_calceolata.AAC.1